MLSALLWNHANPEIIAPIFISMDDLGRNLRVFIIKVLKIPAYSIEFILRTVTTFCAQMIIIFPRYKSYIYHEASSSRKSVKSARTLFLKATYGLCNYDLRKIQLRFYPYRS